MGKRDLRNEVDVRQFRSSRVCRHCKGEFTIVNPAQVYCKICCPTGVAYQRLKLYKLSQPEFEALWKKQSGACALCDSELSDGGSTGKGLNIDHCHETGQVRGLLCHRCNIMVGLTDKGDWCHRLDRLQMYIASRGSSLFDVQKWREEAEFKRRFVK